MKKICTNSISTYVVYGLWMFIFCFSSFGIIYTCLEKTWPPYVIVALFLPLLIIFFTTVTILFSKLHIKKYGKFIEILDNTIIYDNKVFIPFLLIKKIEYKRVHNDANTLFFHMTNDTIEKIVLSKIVVKKIEKAINIKIEYNLKIKKPPFKQRVKQTINKIVEFIKKENKKILFTISGLTLTIISFILHTTLNQNKIVDSILAVICIIFGSLQFYHVYLTKEKYDNFTRKVMSFGFSILFIIILSVIILIFMEVIKQEPTAYCMIWATYLLPSFLIVICILLFILQCLCYV